MEQSPSTIDQNALRVNQALIVILVVIAFVLGVDNGAAWIVAFVAASLAIGAARPGNGPFQLFYRHVLLRTGLLQRRRLPGDPAPHRFAQSMGAAVLAVAAFLLLLGAITAGWLLAWIVVALALTNLVFGFCAGCFIFLQAQRFGVLR